MTGRVSAFQSWYVCERCGWHGGLDDGLCILCQNDPATFTEPVTTPAAVVFEWAFERRCVYCGDVHDDRDDLCARCRADLTADTEPAWRERYA